jgi:ionotropic glutamate receptor
MSPEEWDNPYPCIEEPEVLINQFSLKNSMWFSIGALLQQGSEIAPK